MTETRYASVVNAITLLSLMRSGWRTRAELAATIGLADLATRRLIDALRAGGLTIEQRARKDSTQIEYRWRGGFPTQE